MKVLVFSIESRQDVVPEPDHGLARGKTLTLFTPMSMISTFTTVRCRLVGGPPKCQRLRVASARKRGSPALGMCLSAKNLLDSQVPI